MAKGTRWGKNISFSEFMNRFTKRIESDLEKYSHKGLVKAGYFLRARIREVVSKPAPIRMTRNGYPVAITKATAGDPPRMVRKRLRKSIRMRTNRFKNEVTIYVNARSDRGFNYPRYHEIQGLGSGSGKHKFIEPTVNRHIGDLDRIVGDHIMVSMG